MHITSLVKTRSTRISFLIIGLVLVLGISASILVWQADVARAADDQIAKYQQKLNKSKSIVIQSLNQYSLLLNNGSSLLNVLGNNITQSQWLTFFQSYDLPVKYPGVDAVSFSQYLSNNQLPTFLSNAPAHGDDNLTIYPSGDRSYYAPITYIGYTSPTSLNALGYDQLSNPVLAAAIKNAIRTGKVSMSGVINLVAVNKNQPSFIIYKPEFSGPTKTLAERQSSVYGLVFIAVTANNFFNALLSKYLSPNLAVQVYDQKAAPKHLFYASPSFASVVKRMPEPIYSTLSINYGGNTWDLRVITSRAVLLSDGDQASIADLVVGITLTLVLAVLAWYFTYYRERKLYWQKQSEVQAAKDDLLSLASHQLRTPATVVKQYLGILLQNYSGDITKEQRKLIKTAYDSNERQLDIANQFLNAARLGSGRIVLSYTKVSLVDLIEEVLIDQRRIANKHKRKIAFKAPKQRFIIYADQKYLPMVFENLLSNAIKYSKPNSIIKVKLQRLGQSAVVSVADKGVGIAKEDTAKIFDKFTRASEENAPTGGTGIGLYLAKQITELHGGSINVNSKLNEGSEFIVELPLNIKPN